MNRQHMDKRQLKLGWSLVLVWFFVIAATAFNYQNAEKRVQKIEQMGDHIQEFRNSLYFDKSYQAGMTEQQTQLLNQIAILCGELKSPLKLAWFQPDVQHLLFTTERFVELSNAYVGTELELKELITDIQDKRQQFTEDLAVQTYYYRLSAYIFEALFSPQASNAVAYRSLDDLYSQSLALEDQSRTYLQSTLAQTSSVMGSFAKGGYLVEQLVNHSVHTELHQVKVQYHSSLEKILIFGALVSGALIVYLMGTLHRNLVTHSPQPSNEQNEDPSVTTFRESIHPAKEQEVHDTVEPSSQPESKPQVDFNVMLDSLDGDKESLCMLLEVFIEDHQNDVTQLTQLLNDAPDEAMRKAHSLKGVGGNLGAFQLRDIASKIEIAIQQDITQVPDLLPELDCELNIAITEAKAFIENAQQTDQEKAS
ncbi:Hpt domain-containing protein [Vibrio fluminensis]|uniref:Hpt domain-containing protein n=1 Tax=Vibrio fluminensis TaxID=2783614 RepID=UPI0032AFE9E8